MAMPSPVTMPGVGVLTVHPPGAAGAHDHGRALEQHERAGGNLDRQHTVDPAVLDNQVRDEELIVTLDGGILDGGLEQRVQHVEAGFVGGEPGALHLHSAEEPDIDAAIVLAAPRTAPVLQLGHLLRAVFDEILHRVLVAQPVAARDRVVKMIIKRVVAANHACRATLGRHGVAAHRHHLRYQRHRQLRVSLADRDGRAQSRTAAADHNNVRPDHLHRRSSGQMPVRRDPSKLPGPEHVRHCRRG
jgi:hypothetical protein